MRHHQSKGLIRVETAVSQVIWTCSCKLSPPPSVQSVQSIVFESANEDF